MIAYFFVQKVRRHVRILRLQSSAWPKIIQYTLIFFPSRTVIIWKKYIICLLINGKSVKKKEKKNVEDSPWALILDREKKTGREIRLNAYKSSNGSRDEQTLSNIKHNTHKSIFKWRAESINWVKLVRICGNNLRWAVEIHWVECFRNRMEMCLYELFWDTDYMWERADAWREIQHPVL